MQLRNRVLSRLTSSELTTVFPLLSDVWLNAGQTLYASGDEVTAVYFPSDAVLSIDVVMLDGRAVEAATIGNESVVGVVSALACVPTRARTFALLGGGAYRLPAAALRSLVAESPALLKLLLAHVQCDIAQSEQSVACNALHSVSERLARCLLLMQDRVGSPIIALTHEYLSIMLGVQRTTVTAAAQALKASGTVAYARGRIEVLDRAGLEHISCECYRATRGEECCGPAAGIGIPPVVPRAHDRVR